MKNYLSHIALFMTLAFFSCSNEEKTKYSSTIVKFDRPANAYQFIEPNISVSYDSNFFKISQLYSNTFYGTESYDFAYVADTVKKAIIHIKAEHPTEYPPKKQRDSLMLAGLEEIKEIQNDTLSIVDFDKQLKEINGFSCLGYVGQDKINNIHSTFIGCYRFSDNDNTEVNYTSKGNDLKTGYQILNRFLPGIRSYSQKEIEHEDSLIKSKYTVVVNPAALVDVKFRKRVWTYLGIVSINKNAEHKIAQVRIAGALGDEIFLPNEKGVVPILSNDIMKGNITKRGELVLLNSFGKKVILHFTFNYINKGPVE